MGEKGPQKPLGLLRLEDESSTGKDTRDGDDGAHHVVDLDGDGGVAGRARAGGTGGRGGRGGARGRAGSVGGGGGGGEENMMGDEGV